MLTNLKISIKKIKGNIIDEGRFTETNYPFTMKQNFSTLGCIIEISSQGPLIKSLLDDSIQNLLGVNATTLIEEYNLSPSRVEFLSFRKIFMKTDIAQGMI